MNGTASVIAKLFNKSFKKQIRQVLISDLVVRLIPVINIKQVIALNQIVHEAGKAGCPGEQTKEKQEENEMALIGSKKIAEFLTGEYSADNFIRTQMFSEEWIQMVIDKLGFSIEHEIENASSLINSEIETNRGEEQNSVKKSSLIQKDSSKGG